MKYKKSSENLTKIKNQIQLYKTLFFTNKMSNKRQTKIYTYMHTIKDKQVRKFVYIRSQNVYTFVHLGELLLIGLIWAFTMLHASYDSSYQHLYRENSMEISKAFTDAVIQWKPKANQSKVISVRKESKTHIENTFFPGYCTRGAALISPEFFPFKDDSTQERTRWGNAVDRCENAKDAWYKIWSKPSNWALIVYKGLPSNWYFGHVWKVMHINSKYNSMIIRDMNRLSKYTWTDRREDSNNTNIKCYIYLENNNSDSSTTNDSNSNNPQNPNNNSNQKINNQESTNNQHNSAPKPELEKAEDKTPETNNSNNLEEKEESKDKTENKEKDNKEENKDNIQKPETQTPSKEPENNNFYQTNKSDFIEFLIEENPEFDDLTKHFLSQNEIKIRLNNNGKLTVWENSLLNIEIINKQNKEKFVWVLPFAINIITSNSNLKASLNTIQLIQQQENTVKINAQEKGESSIVLSINNQKIKTIFVDID